MKKFYLLFIFVFGIFNGYSQKANIALTFLAKDSITQNSLVLDSVNIRNITESCDTNLYNPASVLNLTADWPVGLKEQTSPGSESFVVMQNVPNPFQGSTSVKIYFKNDEELKLAVYDDQGRTLSKYTNSFQKGWHLFGISTNESRLLFLKVSDKTTTKTIKLLNNGSGNTGEQISYKERTGQDQSNLKSAPDATGFIFYLGNNLKYTAYAGGYHERILLDNPVSSETYTFNMHPFTLPTVTTATVSAITETSATSGGNVTSDGGSSVTARGVCWSTSQSPTIGDSYTTNGIGTGSYVSNITGLTPNTPYYVRAYATNIVGTVYGNEVNFTTLNSTYQPCPGIPTVTYDGITYNTVQIGTQCWFKENLNVGTMINGSQDQTNNSVIEKYCYNNQTSNCNVYGGLYQWGEMVQYLNGASNTTSWDPVPTGNIQGICPTGWHLPYTSEWTTLINYLGGTNVAGGSMKEAGTTHWNPPNTGATNSSGFTGLPAGVLNVTFSLLQLTTMLGVTDESSQTLQNYVGLVNTSAASFITNIPKKGGLSVRCMKD